MYANWKSGSKIDRKADKYNLSEVLKKLDKSTDFWTPPYVILISSKGKLFFLSEG